MSLMNIGGQQSKSMQIISELIQQSGGIGNLVQKFEQNGLKGIVESWIGSGNNLPINAQQLVGVIGEDKIAAIAAKFGLSSEETQAKISAILPQVIDKMSPNGDLKPDGFNLSSLISLGESFLKH